MVGKCSSLLFGLALMIFFGCCSCDIEDGRVFHGEGVPINDFPWMVVIADEDDHFKCSGVLITDQDILTSAFCATRKPYHVRLGAQYYKRGGTLANIRRVKVHPGYDSRTLEDNIALLQLEEPVVLRDLVKVACFSNKTPLLTKAVVAGYGMKNITSAKWPGTLHAAALILIPPGQCKDRSSIEVPENTICTVSHDKHVCLFDKGGSLFIMDTAQHNALLLGVASWLDCDGFPTVFTKVSRYRWWITTTIVGKGLCLRTYD